MPEEKKKESFTFSDKIKESKQSAPKSFVNRLSSKIGSDGRPRQTLFERTKRDAPFFIAAIVALLLLPFLYKYSGQVNEDASVVTPGYEDAILNPDRSGFDFTGDPEGQISQLAGRDSMDLIVGFGKKKDEESDESLDELYRSGLSDEAAAASSYSRDDMDEEVNNTNIYKYRKNAPRQTRAAFRRAATKIGNLKGAGLNGRGGGVNIQPWGGGLKNAAKKVGAERPRTAPKPVSLQPLTAAGKPSRSSFGQGAAAEARRSKDAMSKHNPLQALMDAQMRPVEPHKIGGIGGGNFGGPGGGNGNLQRAFAFNGKEPWWWDLMKTRSQMEWERHFNRKWKYIDALDDIILGLARCLITGNSDGDPDNFLGSGGGTGSGKKECCGMSESKWKKNKDLKDLPFDEATCKANLGVVASAQLKTKCDFKWKDTTSSGARVGFFGQRWQCLGGVILGAERGSFEGGANCEMFASQGNYEAYLTTKKGKSWYIWHYVVGIEAENLEKYYKASPAQQQDMLKILYVGEGPTYNLDSDPAKNIKGIPLFIESLAVRSWKKGVEYTRLKFDLESGAQKGSTYSEFLSNVRKRGIIIAGDGTDADRSSKFIKRRGKEGKSWVIGARCDYPLARISCETFATVDIGEGQMTVHGVPYAHLSFYNAMQDSAIYQQMKQRFVVAYHIQGLQDNSAPTALSSNSSIATGQWYQVPLYDIKPFVNTANARYVNESSYTALKNRKDPVTGNPSDLTGYAKVKTNHLMTEASGLPGEQYQILATNKAVVDEINKNTSRVVITWEVRQCPDLTIDGKSITNGGCTHGKIATTDKDGNITGWKGHSLPGVVVSTATCVYANGEDAISGQPGEEKCQDGAKSFLPDPKKEGECQKVRECKEGVWGDWMNNPDDPDCKDPDAPSSVDHFKDRVSRIPGHSWDHCLLTVDNRLLLPKDSETLQYVAAAKAKFDAEHKAENKTLEYNENELTVANLVDAIHMDPQNGTVPANTVCLLAKTIGAAARDPQVGSLGFDNLFGAFIAFIGYDAASFPSQRTTDCNGATVTDKRFPCKQFNGDYYWGGYVNQKERLKYEQQVSASNSPWRDFPLRGLLRNPLPQTKTGYMSLTDKENRIRFHKEYSDLMRRTPCTYPAGQKLNRADVLEYITRLCEYGEQIKPKATRKYDCSKPYSDGTHHKTEHDCADGNC